MSTGDKYIHAPLADERLARLEAENAALREVARASRSVWRSRDEDDGGGALVRAIGYLGAVLTAYDQRNHDRAQPEPQQHGGEEAGTFLVSRHVDRDGSLGDAVNRVIEQRDTLADVLGTCLATVVHERNRARFPQDFVGMCERWQDVMRQTLADPAPAAPAGVTIHHDARRDSVECWYCGGIGGEQVGPISDEYDGDVQTRPCYACHGQGRLDLDAVRKLVDDEALDHNTTKDALLRKIEECDALRIQKRQGWVSVADRLPDDLREVLVIADDLGTDYPDGWTALAWYVDGRWFDGATGKQWAHAERITLWHEIASRPEEDTQRAALAAALAAAGNG